MSDGVEILKILKDNIETYFCKCLKIRDKDGNIIVFVPNEHQVNLIKIVEDWKKQYPDERTRPTLFIIILKARQIGFSTAVEGIFFHELHFNPNKIAMVVSYDDDSAQNINAMSDRFYQYLPKSVKPMRRPSRGKGILFENPVNNQAEFEKFPGLQSKFLIDTASNLYAGSSFTINYLHISELGKWVKAKATLKSLMQAVPQYNGIVVVESTANGIEYFHELWVKSKRGEINFVNVFVPWHKHNEYVLPFETEFEKSNFILNDKEKQLQEIYNLTLEQLNWRRNTIKSPKCNGDEDTFDQEYPDNDNTAFLTSGRPVYDRLKIDARIKHLEELYLIKPPNVGYIEYDSASKKMKFISDPRGTVIIYEHPKPEYPYVIGGDTAEGLKDGDWLVSQVCDNTTGNQVAKQRLHIDPDLFALEQIKLAMYYNGALIADEVNNHGHVTIAALKRENYYFQYKREIFDKITQTKEQKFGFDTKEKSRQRVIGRTKEIVRDEIHLINDLETLYEMQTFIYDETGKETAESDCHDDCVPAGTLICTKEGVKPIEQIHAGEYVLTHTGRFKKVLKTGNRFANKVYVIKSTGKLDLMLTGNHRMLLCERKRRWKKNWVNEKPNWINVDSGLDLTKFSTTTICPVEIVDKNYIDLLKYAPDTYRDNDGYLVAYTHNKTRLNAKQNPIKRFISINKNFCMTMGYFLAEGSTGKHSINFASHEKEWPIRNWICKYFKVLGLNPCECKTTEHGYAVSAGNMPLRNFFKSFHNRQDKKLPSWCSNLPIKKKKWILIGYVLGDATFSKNKMSFASISPDIAFFMYETLIQLGIECRMDSVNSKKRNKKQWWVNCGIPSTNKIIQLIPRELFGCKTFKKVQVKTNQTMIRFVDNFLVGKIRDVQEIEFNNTVYNLEVEEDNSYVANGTIVHNCVMSFSILHEARSQQRATPPKEKNSVDIAKYVHPSILIDSTKNPQLKKYYMKQLGGRK